MFENSSTFQRLGGEPARTIRVHLGYVPDLEVDEDRERRGMRLAIAAAVVLHVVLFLVQIPYKPSAPDWQAPQRPVYTVRQIRFEPPEPLPQRSLPKPRQTVKRIPIPDPTPDDPEPIILEEIEIPMPDYDFVDEGIDDFFIPDGPPGRRSGAQPVRVGGGVSPPIKLSGDTPTYTEEARQGRVQGVVILEAIIDEQGNVEDVKVLKGLPLGLTDTAVLATQGWKFRPAMRGSEPVAVYYNLTVRFSLQ